MRFGTVMTLVLAGYGLAGCDNAPRHAPGNPFYVGSGPGRAGHTPDPSVGTGRTQEPTETGAAGGYFSGGMGGGSGGGAGLASGPGGN